MSKLSLTEPNQAGGSDLVSYLSRWVTLSACALLFYWLGSLRLWQPDVSEATLHTAKLTLVILSAGSWVACALAAMYRHHAYRTMMRELDETSLVIERAQKTSDRIKLFKAKIDAQKTLT